MQVRARKIASPIKPTIEPVPAQPYAFPSPIRGWILNESLAAAQPGGAIILDNWVCTTTGIRVRKGKLRYASLGAPVKSIFTYRSNGEKIFAATAAAIFDVSAIVDADTPPAATVSGLTSGDWSTIQFGTAGGNFLYAVNGADSAILYDGTTWTSITGVSTPAITGVTTSDLSQAWTFASRVWFVKKNSLSAYYLPIDSIGGAAVEFPLGGVFTRGGTLVFGAKWSMDAGDGLDDKCVFVSSEGEVAVYEGTNPSSAADWRLAGRYDMPQPLGKNAFVYAGGDLLIATRAGLIPVSAAISTDLGAIETKAVSSPISPYWRDLATDFPAGWVARKFNSAGYMVVSAPTGSSCLVVNLVTGAWSRFVGWDVAAMAEFASGGYFGGADGRIYRMEIGGTDDGEIYTASYMGQHDSLGAFGAKKTVRQLRPTFRASTAFRAQIGATVDFDQTFPAAPTAADALSDDVWDIGLWDVLIWDAESPVVTKSNWFSVGKTGVFIAPFIQITQGSGISPEIELVSIDAMFHAGAIVA